MEALLSFWVTFGTRCPLKAHNVHTMCVLKDKQITFELQWDGTLECMFSNCNCLNQAQIKQPMIECLHLCWLLPVLSDSPSVDCWCTAKTEWLGWFIHADQLHYLTATSPPTSDMQTGTLFLFGAELKLQQRVNFVIRFFYCCNSLNTFKHAEYLHFTWKCMTKYYRHK